MKHCRKTVTEPSQPPLIKRAMIPTDFLKAAYPAPVTLPQADVTGPGRFFNR